MSSSKTRVLIVDDERTVRLSLGGYLQDRGFSVTGAESGEEALERLAAESADVVIVDIRLPGMDGNALILKASEMFPSLKFLVFTGSTDYQPPQSLLDAGVGPQAVLRKPLLDMNTMLHAIRRLTEDVDERE